VPTVASHLDLTLQKRKLYEYVWSKESAFCKLKRQKNWETYHVDSDPLSENLLSLTVEDVRLLATIIRNSRLKPMGRRWNFEDKSAGSVSP
jgi:hypothetical protein